MKNLLYILVAFSILLVYCTPKTTEQVTTTEETVEKVMVEATNQEFRKSAPSAGPAKAVKAGEFSQFQLENGLKVIVVENHKIPRVSYSLILDRNPIVEAEDAGYVDIAGDLITAGTTNRTKAEIDEEIDFIGGRLSSSATSIFASSLTKHQDKILELMSDVLYNANFPESEFEKIKKQYKSNIASSLTNPDAISSRITNQVLYGKDHPYGESQTIESIDNVDLNKVKNYYNTYFKPNISYLIVVGDITADKARMEVEKHFSQWKKGDVPQSTVPQVKMNDKRSVVFVDQPGAVQSVIKIVNPVDLKPGDDMAIAASVANNILGGGVFSGYLMQNLREDKAYTYGARSSLRPDEYVGSFLASASVRNEVTDSSVVEFLRELNRIRNEDVDPDHLKLTLNSMAGSYARSLESPQTVANQAYRIAKYNLPEDYYDTYLQKLEKITAADVKKAANSFIHPNKASIIIVGNKEVADKLARFDGSNEITRLNARGDEVIDVQKEIPADLTAQDVIDSYIAAIGGTQKIKNINTLTWKMEANIQGMTINSTRVVQSPDKFYESQTTQGMEISKTIYDGEKVSMSSPQGAQVVTDAKQVEDYAQSAMIIPELYYGPKGYILELTGAENLDGTDVYNIKITTPEGNVSNALYAIDSGLKLKEYSSKEVQGRPVTITTSYADYEVTNDVKFPRTLKIDGAAPFTIELNTVEISVNEDVDASNFLIK